MTNLFYKYRTTHNFKQFLDILIYSRLYAAPFTALNDPMEGHYLYSENELKRNFVDKLSGEKNRLKICSLSKKSDSHSLWAYYADGYKGVVFGVSVDETVYNISEIKYTQQLLSVNEYNSFTAKEILSQKQDCWRGEEEVRVFTENGKYINVKIEEIIIGHKMDNDERLLIKNLMKNFQPHVKIIETKKNIA